jgi:hypothetical protein
MSAMPDIQLLLAETRGGSVNRLGHGRVRRIAVEFRGDEAVELDILEVSLRMGEMARTRLEADTMLVRLALKALDNAIADYCRKTGARYPSAKMLMRYLDHRPDDITDDPKIVSLPK